MMVNVLKKKISVLTGEVVLGEKIWKNYRDYAYCTKVTVKTNAKQIYQNFDYVTFTNYFSMVTIERKLKTYLKLIEFEVIGEDK